METTTRKSRGLQTGDSFSLLKVMRLKVTNSNGGETILDTTGPFHVIGMDDGNLFVSIGTRDNLRATIPRDMLNSKGATGD